MNGKDDDKIEGLEQTKYKRSNQPSESSKEATKTVAKGAANAYLGPMGGKAVDALSKTKLGDAVLTKGAKALEKSPMGKQMAQMADKSGALNAANQAMDAKSGGSGQAPTSSGSAPSSSMNLGEHSGGFNLLGGLSNKFGASGNGDSTINDEEPNNPTASDMLFDVVKKHGIKAIPPIAGLLLFLIIIVGVIGVILGPADTVIQFFRDSWDSMKTLVGYKSDEQWELEYYKKLDEVQEELNKKYGVCIDINLITATLTIDIENDHYIEEGKQTETDTPNGSELGLSGSDYKKMIKQIELLGNMQIKRTIYGLDEEVKNSNSGTGIADDYCKKEASEYTYPLHYGSDEGEDTLERKLDFTYDLPAFSFFDPLGLRTKLKNATQLAGNDITGIPVRDSRSVRLIAANDIEPGVWQFFTKKANEEKNIEYKFYVPAYTYPEKRDANGHTYIDYNDPQCEPIVPTDPYDFAKLDVGSLNDMENNVYYWNLMDSFIADYYADYLPKVSGPVEVGSEKYEKIKKIISDIYLLYHEMGPSRMCESVPTKNECIYGASTGQQMSNVQVALLQCADDTRFDPIPNETIIDLETYITGVVYAENGGSSNYEALKTQAVAARTYALTNYDKIETDSSGNTLIKLRNCTERQVYCDPNNGCWSNSKDAGGTVHSGQDSSKPYNKVPLPSTSKVWTAVKETTGEVILDSNGDILSIGYTSTEQNKWNSMAADYVTMLMDTYGTADSVNSECKTVGDVSGSGTQGGTLVEGDCSNYSSSSPYWTSLNIFNEPQCTWYAYGRALQILVETAGMNINDARSLMNSMFSSTSGRHAGVWYSMNASTQVFDASTNIDDAKPGALAIWGNNDPNNPYGHVAVVESVNKNSDGTINTVTFTEGNAKVNGNVLRCWHNTKNKNKILQPSNTRYFIGYIYLLK